MTYQMRRIFLCNALPMLDLHLGSLVYSLQVIRAVSLSIFFCSKLIIHAVQVVFANTLVSLLELA